jgi:chemotaxis protein methyltransferase CheR
MHSGQTPVLGGPGRIAGLDSQGNPVASPTIEALSEWAKTLGMDGGLDGPVRRMQEQGGSAAQRFDCPDGTGGLRSLLLTRLQTTVAHGSSLFFIVDVTPQLAAIREHADMVEKHELELQEVRHRMANGLQVIASILRIKARLSRSTEVRSHLDDVHRRVLSIAALEDGIEATNDINSTATRPYLEVLCDKLQATLVDPSTGVELRAESADVKLNPNMMTSLGLVVTELVINSLKHGYREAPNGGPIVIKLSGDDSAWTLSVTDRGAGCRHESFQSSPGLGTRIVRALARRLNAQLHISPNVPNGLRVTLTHREKQGRPARLAARGS